MVILAGKKKPENQIKSMPHSRFFNDAHDDDARTPLFAAHTALGRIITTTTITVASQIPGLRYCCCHFNFHRETKEHTKNYMDKYAIA